MMEVKWFLMLFTILWLEGCSKGCLEHERIALLQLKSFFDRPKYLPNWVDVKGSDCCQWERVTCNVTSRRVIQLFLNFTRRRRYGEGEYGYLNASLFLPFEELKSLDLTNNQIAGFVGNEGFKWLYGLSKLESLDLSGNQLKNDFLSKLGVLSSLKTLNLRYNQFKGYIDTQELNSLKNLRNLDLSVNKIEGLQSFQGSPRQPMINLEVLDLSVNQLKSNSFACISHLSNLKSLNVGLNQLQGFIDVNDLNSLAKLKRLDMSNNEIESFRSFEDKKTQLKLINLEELDLSSNRFNNSILPQLGGLSNLKSLNLQYNQLKGSINLKELESLNNLEELDFSYNELQEFLTFKEIGNLRKLRVASLDGAFINGSDVSLLQVIEAFSSVKTLILRNNYFNKTVSTQDLHLSSDVEELILDYSYLNNNILERVGALTSLKTLKLSDCKLTGSLPSKGWCDLRNIEELYLSRNALEGPIPSCLNNLTSLYFLDISYNHFELPISFQPFANHSHLKALFVDGNNLVREPSFQLWAPNPKFQLKSLGMSNYTVKGLPKQLPNFRQFQYDLRFLELSYNNFGGKMPSWLLENNTRLQQIILRGNSYTGPLQLPRHTNIDMLQIDMSRNKIQGLMPMNICSTFPNLEALSLLQNAFEGNIPRCLGGLKSLSLLDLSYNSFSGGIPGELANNSLIGTLKLSNNNLSGKIPPTIFGSNELISLYLDGNNFDGEIPQVDISTVSFSYLSDLVLNNNHLSGRIPRWIWNMSDVQVLDLSNNHFDDFLPFEFCNLNSLNFLDLSGNNLSGSLPSCFNPPYISYFHLSRNKLSGPLPHALYNKSSLVTVDLSQNNLTGKIPEWIGTLSTLRILLLKANHFEGKIPSQLCQLNSLSIMDLSQNKLSGSIPSCLSNLTFDPGDAESTLPKVYFLFGFRILQDLEFETRDLGKDSFPDSYVEEQVEFITKKGLYTYSGSILNYMSGIDLSCNKLTGQIPQEIGNLSGLHSLNLSHNNLTGFIPLTISKLKQIESLDLSNNNLSGNIPIQLTKLNYMGVFNVSYNDLSGSIPYTAQFATFDESSYVGNPLLCGPPLHENCTKSDSPPTIPKASNNEEEGGLMDKYVFLVSFLVSYGIVLMAIAIVLYINPNWRRAWFYFIGHCITTCHDFIEDRLLELSMFKRRS